MVLDLTTITLFPIYPRRVGIPSYTVHNERQFEQYILKYNGTNIGCHVSVYDCNSRVVIDKVVFDFDGGKNGEKLKEAFEEVKEFVSKLHTHNFAFIPVFSGNRGFHIYVLLQPLEMDSDIARLLLKQVHNDFAGEYNFVDKQKFGVVHAMFRVPNTINMKGKLWCCYLPHNFVNWTLKEVLEFAKQPHITNYKFNGKRYPLITDLANITADEIKEELKVVEDFELVPPKIPPLHLLKDLIRPCVFETLTTNSEPPHFVRLSLVTELKHLGYTPKQVFEICQKIGWSDFDPNVTAYQIKDIYERKLLPPSCKTLKRYVKCTNCGWKYFWVE